MHQALYDDTKNSKYFDSDPLCNPDDVANPSTEAVCKRVNKPVGQRADGNPMMRLGRGLVQGEWFQGVLNTETGQLENMTETESMLHLKQLEVQTNMLLNASRTMNRRTTAILAAEAANKYYVANSYKVQLERLLTSFTSPGVKITLTGWMPGVINTETGRLERVTATQSTPYEAYDPFLQVELGHGTCRGTMSIAMSVVLSPMYLVSSSQWYTTSWSSAGGSSWTDNGGCDNPNRTFSQWVQEELLQNELELTMGSDTPYHVQSATPYDNYIRGRFDFTRYAFDMSYCNKEPTSTKLYKGGTQGTTPWAEGEPHHHGLEQRKKDIAIALKQCRQLSVKVDDQDSGESFCDTENIVDLKVLSELLPDVGADSPSTECAAWFPSVDNALRAKTNALRNYYSDAFLRDCDLLQETYNRYNTTTKSVATRARGRRHSGN